MSDSPTISTAKESVASQVATMRRLSQRAGAWLLGFKSVRTLADRTDAPRNDDGTYDAAALVAWSRQEMPTVEFADEHLEGVTRLAEAFACNAEGQVAGVVRILSGIESKYGPPGLAAVAEMFLSETKSYRKRCPSPYDERPTEESIRDEYERKAADEIANLPTWGAYNDLRVVTECEQCGRYRWGRRWLSPPWPRGYVALIALCPECEQKTSAINGHTND